jgi:sulfur-oxidizing protein SoxB
MSLLEDVEMVLKFRIMTKTICFCFLTLIFFGLLFISKTTSVFASETEQIRIISTNDIHSYLRPIYYRYLDEFKPWGAQSREGDYVNKAEIEGKIGGMAHVATMIKKLRAEKPGKNLLLDAGDTWHGAGLSLFDKGVSMVKIMNAIGYDVMTPGNWEFLYPKDHFMDLVDQANFPVIAYNLTDREWEEPVLDQYVVKKVGNLKVAMIGLTYPWTALTSAITGAAKWFKFGIKEEEARDLIADIRKNENPDLIVFVSHGGYGLDQKFAQRVDGIDIYLSGHTHDEVFDPVVWNDTIIFQGGAHGKYVVSLDVNVKDKKIQNFDYRLLKIRQDQIEPDPEIEKLIEEAYEPYKKQLNEVVGQTKVMLHRRDYFQSSMGNLLTDAMRDSQKTDIAFFPAWRYGATMMPGKITAEDVYNIVPTDGHIFTYSMGGKGLKSLLENILGSVVNKDPYTRVGGDMIRFSGMKLVADLAKSSGNRIISLTVGGKTFSKDAVYSVASAHTRFQNSLIFGASKVKDTGIVFVEELIKYIRNNSPITSALDDRIMIIDFK